MNNRRKVVIAFVALAVLGYCAALVSVSYLREDELEEFLEVSVESDLRFRLSALETYRDAIMSDVNLLAKVDLARNAVGELSKAFDGLGPDAPRTARRMYIDDNPYPAGTRDSLVRANDPSDYSRIHGSYHGWFRAIVGARDYHDLMLVRADGTVVYSVAKQDNFATNLRAEGARATPLGTLFNEVFKSQPESVNATPFVATGPVGGRVAQFVGVPIYADGFAVGALLVQIGVERIERIVRDRGLGRSGLTTYIAASDGRNLIRPGTQPNDLVRLALDGAAGTRRALGIDGRDVFAAFAPVRWIDSRMVLVTEFDMEVANRRKWSGLPFLTAMGALLVALAAFGGWVLGARDPD